MAAELPLGMSTLQASLVRWMTDETHRGIFATDRDLRVVLWNRWMEIHTRRAAAEVLGRSLFELYPEARSVSEYYESALGGRVTIVSHGLHRFLLPMLPTNADLAYEQMPQSGHIGPLTEGEAVVGTVTILEDVSDRLASEVELRRQIEAQKLARATAEKALRAKDEFLSTLSHEIRTPLNAVLGWARILLAREDVDRELLARALHVIERNAAAQGKMMDDMLDMARIVAGKLRLEMQPVDLLSVVLAAVDIVMPSATARRIDVRTSLDPKTPRVLGDQDRLQQIIWNLLSNACKFTEPGGTVDVRLEPEGKVARIVVRDTGQGISPAFLPYVFERFRQDDASSARRHGGLGLGLALVRELVELHGGTVTAHSDGEGKGATFTIVLPTVLSPEVRRNHLDSPAFDRNTAPSLAGIRVLVVEDESDARDLTVTTLQYCGADVTSVSSSADAIAALLAMGREALPHVLVSDIGMPREDGYDLIRQVRALSPERGGRIPALTVTGYATPEDVSKALSAGYQFHVSKPMDPSSLVKAVADLAKRHGERERAASAE
jgi:signal transduction histidine kinase/ActR/RegA family two-component response regulator